MNFEEARTARRDIVQVLSSRQKEEADKLTQSRDVAMAARRATLLVVGEWLTTIKFENMDPKDETVFVRLNQGPVSDWAMLEINLVAAESKEREIKGRIDWLKDQLGKFPIWARVAGLGLSEADAKTIAEINKELADHQSEAIRLKNKINHLSCSLQTKSEKLLRSSLSELEVFNSTTISNQLTSIQAKLAADLERIWSDFRRMETDSLLECRAKLDLLIGRKL